MKSLRIKDRLQRGKAAINAPKNDGVQRMVDTTAKKAKDKGKGNGIHSAATLPGGAAFPCSGL